LLTAGGLCEFEGALLGPRARRSSGLTPPCSSWPFPLVLGSRARDNRAARHSPRFSSRTSGSQSLGSLLRSSTGTRKHSSRAPLSSTRVSCCVFGRRRSSDGARPVRRRTSFTATSLKPGFLYQGTPPGGYGAGRHCRSRLHRRTCSAVTSTNTDARKRSRIELFAHAEPPVPQTPHGRQKRRLRGKPASAHSCRRDRPRPQPGAPAASAQLDPKGEGSLQA
jgi:hypothetical protein